MARARRNVTGDNIIIIIILIIMIIIFWFKAARNQMPGLRSFFLCPAEPKIIGGQCSIYLGFGRI